MDSGPEIEEDVEFVLTLDLFSHKRVPKLLCLSLVTTLYSIGLVNILLTAVRPVIIQSIMLLIMFLKITLTRTYVTVKISNLVRSRVWNWKTVEFWRRILSKRGVEMCSDILMLIFFITMSNGYLYKLLPYSFIPNCIPFLGLADEALAYAFQIVAGVGICVLVLFQITFTASTFTQHFSLHIEQTWEQSSEFVVELSLAEKVRACSDAFFDIHQWLQAILDQQLGL